MSGHGLRDHGAEVNSGALAEAERLMTICNSCRYCEGLCAVFPAMEMRRAFSAGDLNYLANLCHGCGACYYDCQFAPPHAFDVNVPRNFAALRAQSYATYAWPRALSGLFARNGLAVASVAALSVAAFVIGFVAGNDPAALFAVQSGAGAFYRLMPHGAMAAIFGAAFVYAIVAIGMGVRMFWCDIDRRGAKPTWRSLSRAMTDAGRLRNLDGGGVGCFNEDERPNDRRRLYHHFTFYGFLLCLAATSFATAYHYLLGRVAPYAWYDLPVILGTIGGVGLLIGPFGLLAAKWRRDRAIEHRARLGMDIAFLAMLFATSLTGLALLALRETAAMGMLLALHLGVVFGLFMTLPYGNFVHGVYRFAALVRYALERETEQGAAGARAPQADAAA
ncbi:MAG: tricarballylate utilization 4Fe-4S protein TcuB [Proteobacteria bacterium]|nr:tricarballylate utilization 4Fe-4S protein TcuB [Pseudomonadota bacterium]